MPIQLSMWLRFFVYLQ